VGGSPLCSHMRVSKFGICTCIGICSVVQMDRDSSAFRRLLSIALYSLDIISQPLPTTSCGSHTDAPSTLLAPGLQGPALGSALQTAFQLENASTRWLGIFTASTPLVYTYMQSPARPSIRICSLSTWWLAGPRCPIESSRHRQPTAFPYSRGAALRRRPSPCRPCFCRCCR
jgi:hypothetical protein